MSATPASGPTPSLGAMPSLEPAPNFSAAFGDRPLPGPRSVFETGFFEKAASESERPRLPEFFP